MLYESYAIFLKKIHHFTYFNRFLYILPYLPHIDAYCLLVVIFIWGIPRNFPIRLSSIPNEIWYSELLFYFIGVSDVIRRHMATVPWNNVPSVAKGLMFPQAYLYLMNNAHF